MLKPSNQPRLIYCEPQTAGRYKLEFVSSGKLSIRRLNRAALAQPIKLIRAEDTRSPVSQSRKVGVVLFNPATSRALAETNLFHPNVDCSSATQLVVRLTGAGASIDLPLVIPITADTNQAIRLCIANRTGTPLVRVLWARRDEAFTAARSELMPLVQNDTTLREYVVPVGWNEHWSGSVERVRIEFPGTAAGLMDIGTVELLKASSE
jgi:hypothetical protein